MELMNRTTADGVKKPSDGSMRLCSNESNQMSRATRPIANVCCIGAGYVGGPTCAVIASKAPEIKCTVVDLNAERIAAWNSDRLPIYEPKLDEMVIPARDGVPGKRQPNLFFTTNIRRAIAEADVIFISVNTPTKHTGLGAGSAIDLSYVESAARTIAASVTDGYKIIVEKSTVPCRTAKSISDILAANTTPRFSFDVLSNPEFLAEGTAIDDLLYPDRILIGSLTGHDLSQSAAAALANMYAQWVPRERIILMNLWSSELAKIAANSMLAQRISSINSLSAICEATNANIDEISYAIGLDKRIGPHMLKSSVGFGGSCFKKDVLSLVYLADCLDLPEVSAYWRSVVEINKWQKNRFTRRIVTQLFGSLAQKKIAVLGFAYKKNTGDTRESASISVVANLIDERAAVAIYDPQVRDEQIWKELHAIEACSNEIITECVTICRSAYEACQDAHAVVILTEWEEFRVPRQTDKWTNGQDGRQSILSTADDSYPRERQFESALSRETNPLNVVLSGNPLNSNGNAPISQSWPRNLPDEGPHLDWSWIATIMRRPMFVFDGRNIVDAETLEKLGFRVECIGKTRPYGAVVPRDEG